MPCDFILRCGLVLLLAPSGFAAAQSPAPAKKSAEDVLENSIDRWNRMTPEERERELAKLPPARARRIRQRINRYNQMNPQAQQALRQRYQTFSQLPPEQKQLVRQRLQDFRKLPPGRHPPVHAEVDLLRTLPEPQRQARINSEDFRARFSPQEQEIIRDLSTYLPN